MPDPTETPVTGTGLPENPTPQQPQQQYVWQQPQYAPQQPQPQYGWQQAQQPYSYQQAPYPQPQTAAPLTHKKAIGSMVMMLIALTFLAYPLARQLFSAIAGSVMNSWIFLIGYLFLTAGVALLLVGAIMGSRGRKLFGVGLLLCIVCQLTNRVYVPIFWLELGMRNEFVIVLILFGAFLVISTVLTAIGCLARVKVLKILGGILMLVSYLLYVVVYVAMVFSAFRYLSNILYFLGILFVCIAVLTFPIRKAKN